jgi:hypothetical protein
VQDAGDAGRPEAPTTCREASQSILKITVDSSYAFPRAFLAAVWTNLGEGYETLAGRAGRSTPQHADYQRAAFLMHRRSLEIWTDLQGRGVVSPVDTSRVSAAQRAVRRTQSGTGIGG